MIFNRRNFLTLSGAGAAAASLAACAGGATGGEDGKGGEGQKGNGTLQFWTTHPGKSKPLEEAMIKAWNEANPKTPAELITAGANYEELAQKFNAALSGKDLPDVVLLSDVNWFNFALNGQTAALDDLWKEAKIDTKDFVESLLADYKYEGKHYGMPYGRSTCLMYLNKEHLTKAGLPADRGPETWKEFTEWAPKIRAVNGDKPVLAVGDGSHYLDWYFQGILWSFGGAYSKDWKATFTDPKTLEAGQFLQDQVKAGNILITDDQNKAFTIGNTSGALASTGSLSGMTKAAKFEFITTFLPGPGPSCPTGGAGIAMVKGISAERKKIAIKFMDFITSKENTITFSQGTGYMPVRKSALEDPKEKEFLDKNPNAQTAIKQLVKNTKSQDNARTFVPGGGQRIGAALDKITIGKENVQSVFQALNDETDKVIKRDIEPNLKKK